jgi:hypothetical protein
MSTFTTQQLQASAEEAPAVAAAAGASAESLISEWVNTANAAAVDAVAQRGDGPARKAARRALNVLKARGVSIPQATRTATLASPTPSATGEASAWFMPPDIQGNELLVLARPDSSGRYRASFVFFTDGQRIFNVQHGTLSLSKLKEEIVRMRGKTAYSAVRVPWGWAQYRVVELRKWHAERAVPEPLGIASVVEFLTDAPSSPPPHPFDEEGLVLSDEDAVESARDSANLHVLAEFQPMLPTPNALDELLTKIGARFGSTPPEETPKEERNTIIREEVRAAADRYFTPERRQRIVGKLKDCGMSVLARQGEEAALQVAAVIRAIEQAGLITNPPSEIGFLRAFFDKGLAFVASRTGGQLRVPLQQRPQTITISEVPSQDGGQPAGEPAPEQSAAPSETPAP